MTTTSDTVALAVAPAQPSVAGQGSHPRGGMLDHALHGRFSVPLLALLILLPTITTALDEAFYIGVASRILIFALAATSLNLILGFGGLVSFGHAAFVGVGAYTVGILMQAGIASAWIAWPAAMATGALFALVIGAVSLRTKGVYFIMITLAFAQMLYYLMVSLKVYGGEDGLSLPGRSSLGLGIDLGDDANLYYVVLALAALAFVAVQRHARERDAHGGDRFPGVQAQARRLHAGRRAAGQPGQLRQPRHAAMEPSAC
jgi:branched-chain amino acid transport system permease protein